MRLIGSIENEIQAKAFSWYLTQEGIENVCEVESVLDWGDSNYGKQYGVIWVLEEDRWEKARQYYEEFIKNPDDPRFGPKAITPRPAHAQVDVLKQAQQKIRETAGTTRRLMPSGSGVLSLYILFLCCAIFIWTFIHEKTFLVPPPSYLPPMAIESSPLKKALLFDYPNAYRLADKLVDSYGLDKLQKPETLPPEGLELLHQLIETPYWQGVYAETVEFQTFLFFKWNYQGLLFERIQEGEGWRFFSPCFLHADIFHLLFNMIWLMLLSPQIENRIGKTRFLIFIAISALFSNTAQYLMSGANFLGYSGVICGMLSFIWTRQRYTPWEGYLLHRSTIAFIAFFILAMFVLQLFSFFLEFFKHLALTPGIANTAHLTGACVGYLLGRLNFFSVRFR